MCSVEFFINLFFFQSLNLDTTDTRRAWNIKLLTLDSCYSFVQNTDTFTVCLIVAANRFWSVVSEPHKEENWERGVSNLIFEEI
jgi:hypothetical protein